jgi:hypothetical protein
MTTINRRNLFVIATASALVTACKPAGGGGTGPLVSNGQNYGDDPSKPGPSPLSADYYSLVIIRITKDLKFEASHGSFDTPSKTDEAKVRAAVLAQLNGLKPGGDVQSLNPLKDSSGYNFVNWGFGSTRRVYVYVDNATLKFEKNEPLSFKAVSSLRYIDTEIARSRKISPNKSFFGAKSEDAFAKGSLLYFENYFLDDAGKPLPPKPANPIYYSFNFNMLMAAQNGAKPIPIVIDPDGGNGMGGPPPY